MLTRFQFSNFRSFRDETELSFIAATNLKHPPGFGVTRPEGFTRDVVNTIGLFGANASGKTNVARALTFFRDAVRSSHSKWSPEDPIPVDPFRLDPETLSRPTTFQLDVVLRGVPMQYGFVLASDAVLEEWLYSWPDGKKVSLFERMAGSSFRFGRLLKGPNETIAKLTRHNSLFLSAAAQNNHPGLLPLYSWIATQVLFLSPDDEALCRFYSITAAKHGELTRIRHLMQLADLGIIGLKVSSRNIPLTPKMRALMSIIGDELGIPPGAVSLIRDDERAIPNLTFSHASEHSPGGVSFNEEDESRGTLAWLALAGPILRSLDKGTLLVADELDSSLHELLQAIVIRLFNDPKCNPRGAQLLFTSQSTTVLGDSLVRGFEDSDTLLRRDQVWFTEKENSGVTRLVPLTDFKVRRGQNIQRWYLRGRFGAVPILDESLIQCVTDTSVSAARGSESDPLVSPPPEPNDEP